MYLQYINGVDAIDTLPFSIIEVTGGSMEPRLYQGDAIVVTKVALSELELGDMIVFTDDGELITHEVTQIGEDYVIAKGTVNDLTDKPVTEENYKAKVILRIPYLCSIMALWDTPVAFFLFCALLFAVIFGKSIFGEIYDWYERKGETNEKKDESVQ